MSQVLSIGTEKVGTRVYVTGNTYAVKSALKDAGCHWDGDRKQWWIGAVKADAISKIVGGLADGPAPKEDMHAKNVYAKVEYKGRQYYVIARSDKTSKFWLTVLDGSIDFWAAMSDCKVVKTYQGRENYRSGRVEYQTLGSMHRYVQGLKSGEIKKDEYRTEDYKINGEGEHFVKTSSGWMPADRRDEFDEFDN